MLGRIPGGYDNSERLDSVRLRLRQVVHRRCPICSWRHRVRRIMNCFTGGYSDDTDTEFDTAIPPILHLYCLVRIGLIQRSMIAGWGRSGCRRPRYCLGHGVCRGLGRRAPTTPSEENEQCGEKHA